MMCRIRSRAVVAMIVAVWSASALGARMVSLDGLLQPYLERYGLPAIAAAAAKSGRIVGAGAVGTRVLGARIPVTLNDRFHIGSDTKAMTALLAAMLVEQRKLRWDSTIGEVFPELSAGMDPGVRTVTLAQLLSHTGGFPSDNEAFGNLLTQVMQREDADLDEMRYWMVQQWVKQPLASQPGTTFAYSNMGYTLVGAMLERATGTSWDELIHTRLFEPLELGSAMLGCQVTLGRVDAPLGHAEVGGRLRPFHAGPSCDNPPVIGPAGIVSLSVLDFARWAAWNAAEGARRPTLVRPETLRKLHTQVISVPLRHAGKPGTPAQGGYAMGWGRVSVDWAPQALLQHTGSNTKNLAQVWVDVPHDFALVLVTNVGGERAEEALRAAAAMLYRKFEPQPPR